MRSEDIELRELRPRFVSASSAQVVGATQSTMRYASLANSGRARSSGQTYFPDGGIMISATSDSDDDNSWMGLEENLYSPSDLDINRGSYSRSPTFLRARSPSAPSGEPGNGHPILRAMRAIRDEGGDDELPLPSTSAFVPPTSAPIPPAQHDDSDDEDEDEILLLGALHSSSQRSSQRVSHREGRLRDRLVATSLFVTTSNMYPLDPGLPEEDLPVNGNSRPGLVERVGGGTKVQTEKNQRSFEWESEAKLKTPPETKESKEEPEACCLCLDPDCRAAAYADESSPQCSQGHRFSKTCELVQNRKQMVAFLERDGRCPLCRSFFMGEWGKIASDANRKREALLERQRVAERNRELSELRNAELSHAEMRGLMGSFGSMIRLGGYAGYGGTDASFELEFTQAMMYGYFTQ